MTRFEDIKAFAFDIDGVFTDGLVLAMPDGDLLRQFNSKDCYAVRTAVNNGYTCAIITGGVSQSLLYRSRSLGIEDRHLYMLSKDKEVDLRHFCDSIGLDLAQVAFVGDDIPDIPSIRLAGLGVCPADAVAEVREAADMVSSFNGGRGCIRDLVERVLKSQGNWKFDPKDPWKGNHLEHIMKLAKLTGRNI
jgi:3-deoxy-D-manno-octulosonate 8-phosphate phosphatase (KDO 8-P phosphatase)